MIAFEWTGEEFKPLPRFRRECDRHYVVGQVYHLVEEHERSQASHRQYFAAVHDAWLNLPEAMGEQFPTSEHLRKWALIKAGFCNERDEVFSNAADALRAAALIRPADEYAIVEARGVVVKVYTAKSQSVRAMAKDEFEASKRAVLDLVASYIKLDAHTLSANAGAAA